MSFYWIFLLATFVVNISPGPSLFFIFSNTIAHGRKIGIASSLGVCTGSVFHIAAVAIGLSAILAASTILYTIVKYLGALYLICLGIVSFKNSATKFENPKCDIVRIAPLKAFKQGVLVDILNPKIAIFFMAFLPQFVRHEYGYISVQVVLLGSVVILVGIVVEVIFVLSVEKIATFFKRKNKYPLWIDKILGFTLIGLGAKLAID